MQTVYKVSTALVVTMVLSGGRVHAAGAFKALVTKSPAGVAAVSGFGAGVMFAEHVRDLTAVPNADNDPMGRIVVKGLALLPANSAARSAAGRLMLDALTEESDTSQKLTPRTKKAFDTLTAAQKHKDDSKEERKAPAGTAAPATPVAVPVNSPADLQRKLAEGEALLRREYGAGHGRVIGDANDATQALTAVQSSAFKNDATVRAAVRNLAVACGLNIPE